ncbi:SDR family oxidoreductase [Clostridium sardiniense]|uniref:SDR family oxidoreductase n=1 Tax=Clostridium sardiniense TaxID=29369 RepID=A0ABS7KZL5_CLOSR|nr:SDR family oxidoreductase [Clostridium sardiniense]MBY0755957.1 SDR family oxidoreductase [Clostridium sardiniense]MDQ0460753.1 short-subunit dehydrogenase [Clostridium sardiniense]
MDKKYTLITGGTKGIGLELAKLFAKDRNNLIIVARKEDELKIVKEKLEKKFNIFVEILELDLSVDNSCEELIKFVEEKNVVVDNLINNAGVGSFGYFDEIDVDKDIKLIDINIIVLTKLIKYFLPKMKERRSGGILNVASTAAFVGGPKMSTYYSSKAYVLTLSEALYEEAKEFGVNVSCLCPGPVKTSFQENAGIIKSEKAKKYLMDAKDVAKEGYDGFKNKKAIIIPGFKNKAMVIATKFLPRGIIRKIIFSTNK